MNDPHLKPLLPKQKLGPPHLCPLLMPPTLLQISNVYTAHKIFSPSLKSSKTISNMLRFRNKIKQIFTSKLIGLNVSFQLKGSGIIVILMIGSTSVQ